MSVELTSKETNIYTVIKQYSNGIISRRQASAMLSLSCETISRLKGKLNKHGKQAFSHKLKGHTPVNKCSQDTEKQIVDFYLSKYKGWNFEHFIDYINEYKPTETPECFWLVSSRTIKRIIIRNNFLSPQANKDKNMKKQHPVRKRRSTFGELVQLDASIHDWFETGDKATLHLAIDDATSTIVAAFFDKEETLYGYHNIFYQILTKYGVPGTFYTDRRTVFEYKSGKRDEDTDTQFRRSCGILGVSIITTSIAEAKGRVERSFRVHQDRLISEFRLHKVKNISSANKYIEEYIKRHNDKFAIPIESVDSHFSGIPSNLDINKVLSIHSQRTVLNGNVVSFKSKQYVPTINEENVVLPVNKKVIVVQTFNEDLLLLDGEKYYDLKYMRDGKSTAHKPSDNHPYKQTYGKKMWQR
jgi:hypothetical protein